MFRALFAFVMLVAPVMAQAVPCNMTAPKAAMAGHHAMNRSVSAQPASAGEHPCPNHRQQVSQPCDSTMSMADCLDIGMAPSVDTLSLKTLKSDVFPLAVVSFHPGEQTAFTMAAPRAPPLIRRSPFPQPSLILTTQRFRV